MTAFREPGVAGQAALNKDVMQTLGAVERHEFVPAHQKPFAYENRPLPIGHGQTISQPYIVALMTDLIEPDPDDVVLEIGTGSVVSSRRQGYDRWYHVRTFLLYRSSRNDSHLSQVSSHEYQQVRFTYQENNFKLE